MEKIRIKGIMVFVETFGGKNGKNYTDEKYI